MIKSVQDASYELIVDPPSYLEYLFLLYLQKIPHPSLNIRFYFGLGVSRRAVRTALLGRLAAEGSGAIRMVEVGVDTAWDVALLLQDHPRLHYMGVDPYFPCKEGDKACWPPSEVRYGEALTRVMRFPGRASLLRMTSEAAASWIQEGSVDFLWIDALHTYEDAARDLR
eukprot:TRINITY_DN35006_c0_g2_i2.p1 TRINITY_DN35006_c0_g2~~TRINITY_DN35006_c0_g2_i2.p1  ORF type:complete len:169 (-),score=16.40 TRINITY_DN35006_c0_g2_i2:181-687(-)